MKITLRRFLHLKVRLLLLLALALPALADPSPAFVAGGRWAVFGDSISQTGAYHREIELFHLTRQSSQPLDVINSSVSGDTAVGSLRRIGWDCLAASPTVVSVMLGMNDVKPSLYTGSGPSPAKRPELATARSLAAPGPHSFTLTAVPAVPSVTITNPASPAVSLADLLTTLRLEASVSASSVAWSLVNGPGTVTFSAPAAAQTNATFSAVGTYTLQCTATNEGGTSTDRVHVGVAAPILIPLRQLRQLSAIPVEGAGISDGTAGSNLGTGTGATWTTRTGGSLPADLWTSGGGDFAPGILADTPGFNATVAGQNVILPTTTALTAAAQAALAAAQPLNLILSATNESLTTSAFARLASDDDSLETNRPMLRLTVTGNPVPTVNPGPSPTPSAGSSATLSGLVTGSTFSEWRVLSGAGNASFSDSALAASNVTFDQAGAYLLEWALHLDAKIPGTFTPPIVSNTAELQYTYTRRKTAPGEATFQIEWSDTLANDWSTVGVIQDPPVSLTASGESVTARIPVGSASKRFLRLKITIP